MRKAVMTLLLIATALPAFAGKPKKNATTQWPELLLEGGRKVSYVQTITSQRDAKGKGGFWNRLGNVIFGEPDYRDLVRPYSIAVDSHGRILVTDPGMRGVHVFDLAGHKYHFIEHRESIRDSMEEPQCVAVDAKDNIYVTDSKAGKIFVFHPNGKFSGVFGSIKGEGYFKRPTGIAIDPETQNIYVTDTLRDKIFILGPDGKVIKSFGEHGGGNGDFNFPTEIHIKGNTVAVVDAMNFRVELFDRQGNFRGNIGVSGDPNDGIFRPKGISIDSEDHVYLVEGQSGMVRVYDQQGQLLYYFGNGSGFGQFVLPSGLCIDPQDRIYVVDSYNRRVQVFQYHALKPTAQGAVR